MVSALLTARCCDRWCKSHSTNRQTASRGSRRTASDSSVQELRDGPHWCHVYDKVSMASEHDMPRCVETSSSRHFQVRSFVARSILICGQPLSARASRLKSYHCIRPTDKIRCAYQVWSPAGGSDAVCPAVSFKRDLRLLEHLYRLNVCLRHGVFAESYVTLSAHKTWIFLLLIDLVIKNPAVVGGGRDMAAFIAAACTHR